MRKLVFILAIAVLVQSFVSAQGWRGYGQPVMPTAATAVTVTGTLGLQHGRITIQSDDTAYYVPILERYIGFIEGLKDGARVSVEGYVQENGVYPWIRPVKVTVNGKVHDFSPLVSSARDSRHRGYDRNDGHNRYGGRGHRW
jgi:hypothetical protein